MLKPRQGPDSQVCKLKKNRSTNAENREKLREHGLREVALGRDIYVVPALLYREVIPVLLAKISACKTPEI